MAMSPFKKRINSLILNNWIDPKTDEFCILTPEEVWKLSSLQRAYYFSELHDKENFKQYGLKKYAEWYNRMVAKLESNKKDPLEYYAEFSSYSSELLKAMMNDANVDAVKKSVVAKILKDRGKIEEIKKLQ